MDKNPYADGRQLAELLWETELVADRYSNGNLILIKTRDGWRCFFAHFSADALASFEGALDDKFPSHEAMLRPVPRMWSVIHELHRVLSNAMNWFQGYRPMKMIDDLGGGDRT
jgi:hypothetical protein